MSGDTPRTGERWGLDELRDAVWDGTTTQDQEAAVAAFDSLRTQLEQTQAELRGTSAGAERLRAEIEQTRENLTKCRKRAAELGSRLETAHHEVLERLRERDEAHAQLEQTEKERDEFKDFWENATDLAAEARAEVEQLRAIEEAAKVIDALAQQRSCSLYEVAHESWPGQFGQLHRALTTQEDR